MPAATATATTSPLGPRSPEELMARFGQHVGRRELDRLMELYEPTAVFIPAPGVRHVGLAAIRDALGGMLALAPTMDTRVEEVHQVGELALVIVSWTMRGTAPDGSAVSQGGRSADVLRRQPDGSWLVLIDHP